MINARQPDKYYVMEMFETIQGEGFHTGRAAFFIRLGGCDVGCHWCDVKESWSESIHQLYTVEEIMFKVRQSQADIVVVTGGEPTMHNLTALAQELKNQNLSAHIETSGTNALTGDWDWITFSPKKFKKPHPSFGKLASELKVVVYNKSDLEFAKSHATNLREDAHLYLQPEWDRKELAMPLIVDYIKKNPRWRVSLQSHKYLNIP